MTVRELERLLWRWQYGRLSADRLELQLRDAVDLLGDDVAEWLDAAPIVRMWSPALIETHIAARREASYAVDRHQFREAVRQIALCVDASARLRELLAADRAAGLCEEAVLRLHELAAVPRLRALPSIAALAQQVDAVRIAIAEGRYAEASIAATLCTRLAEQLLRRADPNPDERDRLRERLRELTHLWRETQPFAAADDDPAEAIERLRALVRENSLPLAERLALELEIELGPRRRFLTARPLMPDDASSVKAVVRERAWDGAVDHYWHLSIAHNGRRLAKTEEAAAEVARGIAAALETK